MCGWVADWRIDERVGEWGDRWVVGGWIDRYSGWIDGWINYVVGWGMDRWADKMGG